MDHPRKFSIYTTFALFAMLMVSACVPRVTPGSRLPVEPETPTPEIFSALAPSPTPADSTLPLTCQVTDLSVYVNEESGYCFAYPGFFRLEESDAPNGLVSVIGPNLDDSADPVRATLGVTTQPVPAGSQLNRLVNGYLALFLNPPWQIGREQLTVGGEPAEKLEPVPGLGSARVVLFLHENMLFTLLFHPIDLGIGQTEVNDLTQTVLGSFAFFPASQAPTSQLQTVSWDEFGRSISLSYDSILAPWVEPRIVPAVPQSDQVLFSGSYPDFAQFRFLGFHGGRVYQLPTMPVENHVAQVAVFPTRDFASFGGDYPQGFTNQLETLKILLRNGLNQADCVQPLTGRSVLPFLPRVNSAPSFCAQPQLLEFNGGRGVRYLTQFTQGVGPVMDGEVFYTFQGITDDEQFYISVVFPVGTGVFPTEPFACAECSDPGYDPLPAWQAQLSEQLGQLNAQPADRFTPSLQLLDDVVRSLQIGQ